MKEALIAYLVAAGLNLALLWREMDLPFAAATWRDRPALVRVYEGARVAAIGHEDCSRYALGLILDWRLHLSLGDAQGSLFPGTARLLSLEAPVSVLN